LDTYAAKLAPATGLSAASDSGYDSSSTRGGDRDSIASSSGPSFNVADMPMVQVVGSLFQIPEHALQQEIDQIRTTCTEKVRHDRLSLTFLMPILIGRPNRPQNMPQKHQRRCSLPWPSRRLRIRRSLATLAHNRDHTLATTSGSNGVVQT
jgi:hypothetical protein